MAHISFPSIENFHNVRKLVQSYPHLVPGTIDYRGKIKIHGTNAGVKIDPNGRVQAQSRTEVIGVGKDNAGFAAWVDSTNDYWSQLASEETLVVFGEWAGPGIQKGVAVNQIAEKSFFVFAVLYGSVADGSKLLIDPTAIERLLNNPGVARPANVYVLPWETETVTINFNNVEDTQNKLNQINQLIAEIDNLDPYIKRTFEIGGTGEGIVYVPVTDQPTVSRHLYSSMSFKAKGEKHKVIRSKSSVQLDPEVAKSIEEFANLVVTVPRLEQGVAEGANGVFDVQHIGAFLAWFGRDIQKECADELQAAELEWHDVARAVQTRARQWYMRQIEKHDN